MKWKQGLEAASQLFRKTLTPFCTVFKQTTCTQTWNPSRICLICLIIQKGTSYMTRPTKKFLSQWKTSWMEEWCLSAPAFVPNFKVSSLKRVWNRAPKASKRLSKKLYITISSLKFRRKKNIERSVAQIHSQQHQIMVTRMKELLWVHSTTNVFYWKVEFNPLFTVITPSTKQVQ